MLRQLHLQTLWPPCSCLLISVSARSNLRLSVVRLERWQALTPEQRRSFPPICPDVVLELASPSDQGPRSLNALRRKMVAYQANWAQLGWLLIPEEQAVEVWPAAGEPRRIEAATQLDGGQLLPGLRLELQDIWQV